MPFDNANTPSVAARMRIILGTNGENWAKGQYCRERILVTNNKAHHQGYSYCLLGAFAIATGRTFDKASGTMDLEWEGNKYMRGATNRGDGQTLTVAAFNDLNTWPDMVSFLDRLEALELQGQMAELEMAA